MFSSQKYASTNHKPSLSHALALRLAIAIPLLASGTAILPRPTIAAQRINISYAPIERSISVKALADYAQTGKLDDELATYAKYAGPQSMERLQRVLKTKIDLGPVAVSQFFYTPQGEALLQRLGQIIKTESRQPGFYALRSALILAAADRQGLTLLNVLRYFPSNSIRVDLRLSLQMAEQVEGIINQTNKAIALVADQSSAEITNTTPKVDFAQLPDLRKRGRFNWNKQTLTLEDKSRDRIFPADIYLPVTSSRSPVIVISHGLGSDRTSLAYLARQLASYGFAVAVPEHPGSNAEQLRLLLTGRANTAEEPSEFINRPYDVKYLLNRLQALSTTDATYQHLDLTQVGVIGQSFGGYTALALAGAPLNFSQLEEDCKDQTSTWNVSLLLQCRALELPETQYNLSDPRIKAAIAINPITSSVFGESSINKIKVPVMIVSSSNDTVAPALSEQISPFTWLDTKAKYLVVLGGATHFSAIDDPNPTTDPVTLPLQVIGPNPAIARRYLQALSVAFCQTYIANDQQYRPYLSASYAQAINQFVPSINLVQSLPSKPLNTTALTPK